MENLCTQESEVNSINHNLIRWEDFNDNEEAFAEYFTKRIALSYLELGLIHSETSSEDYSTEESDTDDADNEKIPSLRSSDESSTDKSDN